MIAVAVLGFNILGDGLRDSLEPKRRRPGENVLTVRGLSVTVRDTKLVRDIDLTIRPGEHVALIGAGER